MNENTNPESSTVTESVETPAEQFRKLLDILDPPSEITVTDVLGTTHRVGAAVSARQQIKILREFEAIKELPVASNIDADDVSGVGLAGVLVKLASDPDVLTGIATCFAHAHPIAVTNAANSAKEAGIPADDAADLFPIEEMVAGLIPLFGRLVQRSAGAIQALDGMSQTNSMN